jgi:hypothetical protein
VHHMRLAVGGHGPADKAIWSIADRGEQHLDASTERIEADLRTIRTSSTSAANRHESCLEDTGLGNLLSSFHHARWQTDDFETA